MSDERDKAKRIADAGGYMTPNPYPVALDRLEDRPGYPFHDSKAALRIIWNCTSRECSAKRETIFAD